MEKNQTAAEQHELIGAAAEATGVGHNSHPDAQWFGEAGLGLFLHWGISSVEGKVDLSWGMIKNTPWNWRFLNVDKMKPVEYYAQAERFDPEAYDPDLWMAAAADAGVKYVVLTTKHHDGYALWPSKYGELSTRTHMHGRDLLRPYVEACRRHGLKVGFYYSPPDWYYCREYRSWGYPKWDIVKNKIPQQCIDLGLVYDGPDNLDMNWEPCEVKKPDRAFLRDFYAYIRGQVIELLTWYGKIDVLWFDGTPGQWIGGDEKELDTPITIEEIRQLQPGIVVNPRMHGTGDFVTPECHIPAERPEGWWEGCFIWNNGSWGYTKNEGYKPTSWMLDLLAKHRAWEGNLLMNCAPRPDGRMPENFYRRMEELGRWMKIHKEAVFDVQGGLYPGQTSVPATRRGKVWYLFMIDERVFAVVHGQKEAPVSATLMQDGSAVKVNVCKNGDIMFITDMTQKSEELAVIRVEWP